MSGQSKLFGRFVLLEDHQAVTRDMRAALRAFVDAAKSWHEFHHGTEIGCDELCKCIPAGEAALNAEGVS